jgi:hypothetical protein
MRRDHDVPPPSLIAGLSTRQRVLVVEVVCSSPTSLFSALDQAATHMDNNAETAAYIIFYFSKLRRSNVGDGGNRCGARCCSRGCPCWRRWRCRDSAIHFVWHSHTSLCDSTPWAARRVLGWSCCPAFCSSRRGPISASGYAPQFPWCRWCRNHAHDRRRALASSGRRPCARCLADCLGLQT